MNRGGWIKEEAGYILAGRTKKSTEKRRAMDTRKTADKPAIPVGNPARRRADRSVLDNIWGLILIAFGIFLFAAVSFHAAGQLGNRAGDLVKGLFGVIGFAAPIFLIIPGVLLMLNKIVRFSGLYALLSFVIFLMLALLNAGRFLPASPTGPYGFQPYYDQGVLLQGGGVFGMNAGMLIVRYLGKVGLYGGSICLIAISLLLIINMPVSRGISVFKEKARERAKRKDELLTQEENAPLSDRKPSLFVPVRPEPTSDKKLSPPSPLLPPSPLGDKDAKKKEDFIALVGKQKDLGAGAEEEKEQAHFASDLPGSIGIEEANAAFELPTYGIEEPRQEREGFGLESPDPSSEREKARDDLAPDSPVQPAENGIPGFLPKGPGEASIPSKLSKRDTQETLSASDFSRVKKSGTYHKPIPGLLLRAENTIDRTAINRSMHDRAALLERTLASFNVDARVVQVTRGPAVTRYEIQPDVGVKVSRIVGLADDIALNLRAKSIRIEAPIPGKAAVGIEIENETINMVSLREIIESREFRQAKSKISFCLGRDIGGRAIVGNLHDMPHLLIAGSTGSGKSVCINSIITSFLYKADPDEVKLVLIDPKVVELGNYNGIPHLLIPVVTEPKKASAALNWAVAEMTDRYKKFAARGAKDIQSYNHHLLSEGKTEDFMPQIVIIIDELADLMMAAPAQVEEAVCRLAQLARAAGMHLIVATQRPSVDIITGLIKANIPSRIAFAVSSQFDSRTIIDIGGAEKLVGKGDMLYKPMGLNKPIRVQGCFVSEEEVNDVIRFVKNQVEEETYSDTVMDTIENGVRENGSGSKKDEEDELMDEAVLCVIDADQASASMLQRRFRIGYNRAARLIDAMEEKGLIGQQDGSRPRQVLISKDQYLALKNGGEDPSGKAADE